MSKIAPVLDDSYEQALATIAMPENTNANGDIFGGWLMSQMDLAGSVVTRRVAQSRVVTAVANDIQFIAPIKVGELVQCYGKITKIGRSSVAVDIIVTADKLHNVDAHIVASGSLVYVSIDDKGKPTAIDKS